ncbi:BREX-2 system phosphatase PglZ [Micromonospora sp. WMMD1102]|uniref:BREX-2 system phosphatase PglZ n=1 Tax=Micromonospora sp. WMMD1102 TaxID=3016105 RepID=UPI0024151786|nr:BREX-2 system phosphatase PglZ [Micromonospora sp. WMMD1102]MDG4791857.1 BREX-2 system phosphatase PglZ [Micromonospora sp. WMMD1102]
MTVSASSRRALPVNPHTLAQRIRRRLRNTRPGNGPAPVLLVDAVPDWPYDAILTVDDKLQVRVVACRSTLAIWEQLAEPHDLPTVLLTDLAEQDLGLGILSRVHQQRILSMEPWTLIKEAFGARQLDPRLAELPWAGRALLEATPPGGWPQLPGIVLHRDTALRHLTVERLHLGRLGTAAEDIDPATLLRWSALPVAPQALTALPEAERAGLLGWLGDEFGPALRMLAVLHDVGHVTDTLPLGLVCGALWAADDPDSLRAQGRVEQYLGGIQLDRDGVAAFAAAAHETMLGLLTDAAGRDGLDPRQLGHGGPDARQLGPGALDPRQLGHTVLDRAEELLLGFAATGAARHSDILRSSFTHRLGEVAEALGRTVTRRQVLPDALPAAATAVARLAAHRLAAHYPHRVERAEMALRLARWLTEPAAPPAGVAEGIGRQIEQWSWVDLALEHVWTGEDAHAELAATYRLVHDQVRQRRRELDRAFAAHLADWTAAGAGGAGDLLTVETVLSRVVAPVVREDNRPVLVVVVDGMTAAIAADLAEQLTRQGWLEYDPLAVRPGRKTEPRRRGVVAALPTVTTVSRTSLLSGELRAGGQSEERAGFERNPLWQGRPAKLFHKGTLQGDAGEVLSDKLIQALGDPGTVVGVVVNTVDDALRYGRESADAGWRIDNLGALRALLDYARYQGRAVVVSSDHGHVLDRDTSAWHGADTRSGCDPDTRSGRDPDPSPRPVADPASARHRADPAPATDGEVELVGSRVVADGNRVVALWDPQLRYLPRQAGYHGGASLAEVTVPLLALLPLGAAAPPGWRLLSPQRPAWWTAATDATGPLSSAPPTQPAGRATSAPGRATSASGRGAQPSRRERSGARRHTPTPEQGGTLFELPAVVESAAEAAPPDGPAARPDGPAALVDALLGSEMFTAQHSLTPRKVPIGKIRGALIALLDANGVLPAVLVAEQAGEQPVRATGFVTTLQRIFNVDNFPVLSLVDDGRTVRLDLALLREQFQLPGSAGRRS